MPPVASTATPWFTVARSTEPPVDEGGDVSVEVKLPMKPVVLASTVSRWTVMRGSASTVAMISARNSLGPIIASPRASGLPAPAASRPKWTLRSAPPSSASFSTRCTANPCPASDSAAVIPAGPPPTTSALLFIAMVPVGSASSSLARAADMRTRSLALAVAAARSFECTHEH